MVSVERIYQHIRQDKAVGGELYKQLHHRLKHRKRMAGAKTERIKGRLSIDERPAEVNDRERFGDWEMDLMMGKGNKTAIVTLVERKTGFFMMAKSSQGKNAKSVIKMLLPYKEKAHSKTTGNGSEFADHKAITAKLDAKVYFTHPYCSWEKGLIEYTNKLIRQYLPKKESLDKYNDMEIKQIQYKINRRPRKNLNFETPKNLFFKFAT